MFEQIEAIRFDRAMSVGRTRPMLLSCEYGDEDGEQGVNEVEVIAKFSAGCSIGGLIREAMTAMLALDLGLPCPPPYLVKISDDFISSISDSSIAEHLRASDRFGFGSTRLPNGYGTWVPPLARMSDSLEQEARGILALDCWLTNPDRRISNHNLLTDGRHFAIFDHELALMGHMTLFWKTPWTPEALESAKPPIEHIFYEHLKGRSSLLIDDLCDKLAALTDGRINAYGEALPASWATEKAIVQEAKSFIMNLRDNLNPALTELRRVMS